MQMHGFEFPWTFLLMSIFERISVIYQCKTCRIYSFPGFWFYKLPQDFCFRYWFARPYIINLIVHSSTVWRNLNDGIGAFGLFYCWNLKSSNGCKFYWKINSFETRKKNEIKRKKGWNRCLCPIYNIKHKHKLHFEWQTNIWLYSFQSELTRTLKFIRL